MNETEPQNKINYFLDEGVPSTRKELSVVFNEKLKANPDKSNDYHWMQVYISLANSLMLPIQKAHNDKLLSDDQYLKIDEQHRELKREAEKISNSSNIYSENKKAGVPVFSIIQENKEELIHLYMDIVDEFNKIVSLTKK